MIFENFQQEMRLKSLMVHTIVNPKTIISWQRLVYIYLIFKFNVIISNISFSTDIISLVLLKSLYMVLVVYGTVYSSIPTAYLPSPGVEVEKLQYVMGSDKSAASVHTLFY